MSLSNLNSPFDAANFLQNLSTRPGVYRMLSANGEILYIGKARNLKARISSYFRGDAVSPRIQMMISQIGNIEITITHNEIEALLLENNLIKQHKPRYNVYLRDDKSYPYIYLSSDSSFPRLAFDRGKRQGKGRYFGPYPSASAVRQTLSLLQKLFRIRQCDDTFFKNRSRPCLQYQIKRCTAPCVGLVDEKTYQQDVKDTAMLLEGKSRQVTDMVVERMDAAAQALNYEAAARYRDQIQLLRKVYDKQYVSGKGGNFDIVGCELSENISCVQIFYIRDGRNLGNKAFFPRTPPAATRSDVLQAFMQQYYLQHEAEGEIIISDAIEDRELLEKLLSERAGKTITINQQPRGDKAKWLQLAATNAKNAVQIKLSSKQNQIQRMEDLQQLLELESLPERIECFDISHTQGEATVAACVVFDGNGPVKSDYRRFNIRDINPGDDYAALRQALERRYTRLKKGEGKLPDILFIDGGKGQVKIAMDTLEELQVPTVTIIGIAKGPDRIAGQEKLIIADQNRTLMPSDRPGFLLIQAIRDEAHRFAISGHRLRRKKTRNRSILEDIPGMGSKRRQQLLKHFGGIQGLQKAGIDDIAELKGISRQMAREIYATLHGEKSD